MILQVGVKVLLKNEEGKILILKRSEEKYGKTDGAWDIVGGRIDPGVPLLENLEREILEETSLKVSSGVPKLIAAQDIIRNGERHVVRLTYTAYTSGTPQLDMQEHSEYKWVSFEELEPEEDMDVYTRELISKHLLTDQSW